MVPNVRSLSIRNSRCNFDLDEIWQGDKNNFQKSIFKVLFDHKQLSLLILSLITFCGIIRPDNI